MIVPSIDLMQGRAVQLRRGRDFVLDGGDPLARLEEFAVVGEVAVVDLDAALDRGSNAGLMRQMNDPDTAQQYESKAAEVQRALAESPDKEPTALASIES